MLQDVPERDHSSHAIETAYVNALKFVFEGSVDIDDRPVKVWTKVRVWIKQEFTRRHALRMRPSDPDNVRLDSEVTSKAEGGGEGEEEVDASQPVELLKANPKLGQKVSAFAAENPLVECGFSEADYQTLSEHHSFARLQVNFRKKIKDIVGDVISETLTSTDAIFNKALVELQSCLDKEFEPDMMDLAKKILVAACKTHQGQAVDVDSAFVNTSTMKTTAVEKVLGVPSVVVSTGGPLKGLVPL